MLIIRRIKVGYVACENLEESDWKLFYDAMNEHYDVVKMKLSSWGICVLDL